VGARARLEARVERVLPLERAAAQRHRPLAFLQRPVPLRLRRTHRHGGSPFDERRSGRVRPALAGTAGVLARTAVELLLAARRTEIVAPALVLGNADGRVLVHLHVADGVRVYGHGDLLSAVTRPQAPPTICAVSDFCQSPLTGLRPRLKFDPGGRMLFRDRADA